MNGEEQKCGKQVFKFTLEDSWYWCWHVYFVTVDCLVCVSGLARWRVVCLKNCRGSSGSREGRTLFTPASSTSVSFSTCMPSEWNWGSFLKFYAKSTWVHDILYNIVSVCVKIYCDSSWCQGCISICLWLCFVIESVLKYIWYSLWAENAILYVCKFVALFLPLGLFCNSVSSYLLICLKIKCSFIH